jgi:hypothetical protein
MAKARQNIVFFDMLRIFALKATRSSWDVAFGPFPTESYQILARFLATPSWQKSQP